jgi:nickel/cobalt exporter
VLDLNQLFPPQGAYSWLYLPTAIALGALHGLEPGHSKTLMAAFIVAIRGTVRQAVLLGLSAAVSHTAIVAVIALVGLQLGTRWQSDRVEPIMQLVAAAATVVLACWMIWRTYQESQHDHDHDHDHHSDGASDHEREHTESLRKSLRSGAMTRGRLIWIGLTGGLVPCPASITVLMVCLQLRQFSLGVALVAAFGLGLALTLVLSGVAAALGSRQLSKRFGALERIAHRAPYLSGALMLAVACYMALLGWHGLAAATST